jgi:hypothetical protein
MGERLLWAMYEDKDNPLVKLLREELPVIPGKLSFSETILVAYLKRYGPSTADQIFEGLEDYRDGSGELSILGYKGVNLSRGAISKIGKSLARKNIIKRVPNLKVNANQYIHYLAETASQ